MNDEIRLQEPKLIGTFSVNNAVIWASMTLDYLQYKINDLTFISVVLLLHEAKGFSVLKVRT
jgi:hypothetical protein